MGKFSLRVLIIIFIVVTAIYIAMPFWTAWTIQQAIKNGDVATLQAKVVWPSVRQSLRQSIIRQTKLLPPTNKMNTQFRPTLWQHIRFIIGKSMLDHFMDLYITAEGLPRLYRVKKGYHPRTRGRRRQYEFPIQQQKRNLYQHLKRTEFTSLNCIEIEIEYGDQPKQHLVWTLERFGFEWKLTHFIIKSAMSQKEKKDEDF